MSKWADFVISEASYDSNHLISKAKQHKDSDKNIEEGKFVDRPTIISNIKNGLSYITIYSGLSSWKQGHRIRKFRIEGQPYLRIDDNKVKLDNLGDLPQVSYTQELDLSLEPIAEEEATSEQFRPINEPEKENKKIETDEIEHEIIQTLRKQIQKLDDIENNLQGL